ncbi:hypothetical protein KIH74_29685 [Kineosporia sp. J2-2]|uniref:SWIM-type domain-containing protein n=1 Tax=Kineosporia corallincola TaxID=2835133 RepID=A0ABS5TQJ4_9ACTN|nr:hypothetical protein [Kineosporia corallincola]MBT0773153.1 hypothetical protein [Kineosporia corallincola]
MKQDDADLALGSTVQQVPPVHPRKLAKVPFLELSEGRLQGVVSSGSDIERVYVSSVSAGDHGLSCSTNNNRPCGGLGQGYSCKHIQALLAEAEKQFGAARVARYLSIETADGQPLFSGLHPTGAPSHAAEVFSSFLRHLAYLELPVSTDPLPELSWFPAGPVPA